MTGSASADPYCMAPGGFMPELRIESGNSRKLSRSDVGYPADMTESFFGKIIELLLYLLQNGYYFFFSGSRERNNAFYNLFHLKILDVIAPATRIINIAGTPVQFFEMQ